MRKRIRKAWPTRVYKFWVRPLGEPGKEIPQLLWDTAKLMNKLWSDMAVYLEADKPRIMALPKPDQRAAWEVFNADLKKMADETTLNWQYKEALCNRFRTSAIHSDGDPKKKKSGLFRICIPHRFTGTGMPISKFFDAPNRRVYVSQPDAQAYLNNSRASRHRRMVYGTFGIADPATDQGAIDIRFRSVFHREIPHGAVVKNVAWLGTRRTREPWRWEIAITVELPPSKPVYPERKLACGLDLGWRVMGESMRVGLMVDELGRIFDFRVNLRDVSTNRSRRNPDAPDSYFDLMELDSKMGHMVDQVKATIQDRLPGGFLFREMGWNSEHWQKVRQGGIVRLLYKLQELKVYDDVIEEILVWRKHNDQKLHVHNRLYDRLNGRRDWLYRNLSKWIAETYATVAWEDTLEVKKMAEEPNKSHALSMADRYRQWAAIGELRLMVRQGMAKYDSELFPGETRNSTVTCWRCGNIMEPTPALIIKCGQCGWKQDQDINAALNLLSQVDGMKERLTSVRLGGRADLQAPDALKLMVMPVLLSI